MKERQRPLISAQIPNIGDGTLENRTAQMVLDKIAPIINNIARELGMFNARIAQLEAIGPSVRVSYGSKSLSDFKEAIDMLRPPDLFSEFQEKIQDKEITEKINDSPSQDAA